MEVATYIERAADPDGKDNSRTSGVVDQFIPNTRDLDDRQREIHG